VVLTADWRSLSCLLGFFQADVVRFIVCCSLLEFFIQNLLYLYRSVYMQKRVCEHLSHKKIKVKCFCSYIQELISSACAWFTEFLRVIITRYI